jgi:hypothetical protein
VLKISSSSLDTMVRWRWEGGMCFCFREMDGICREPVSGCDKAPFIGDSGRWRGLRGELIALVCGGVGSCEGCGGAPIESRTNSEAAAIAASEEISCC